MRKQTFTEKFKPHDVCEDSVVMKASSICTNEPMGEDLCVGHVLYGSSDWELIG